MKKKRVFNALVMIIKLKPSLLLVNIIKIFINIIGTVVINILLYKALLDAIFINRDFMLVCKFLSLQIIFSLINYLFEEWYSKIYKPIVNNKLSLHFQITIKNKCITVDESEFNNQHFYDKYSWIVQHSANHFIEIYDTFIEYINNILILVLSGGIFFYMEPLFAICSIICFIITFICDLKANKVRYKRDQDINPYNRKSNYITRINYLKNYAQEFRTTNISLVMNREYYLNYLNLNNINKNYGKKISKYEIVSGLARLLLGTQLPYIMLGAKALLTNSYTASEIAILVGIIQKSRMTLSIVASIYPKIKQNGMYLEDYYNFMQYKPKIDENENGMLAQNKCNSISIKNLYFQYDNNYVLRNINMEIKAGEKIAIVGSNGAGKTTLIKLLLRLYSPTKGTIEMDGVPVEKYKLSSYRGRFGVAHQEVNIYSASVAENVLMDEYSHNMKVIVNESLNNSGIFQRINQFPLNIESIMTKEFDNNGIELSGGEAQKIALSRVFAKDCGIVILDEPSSALDPISEYEMYKNMMNLSQNKTFIVISHRLSITRDVDRIYLLDNGEILECGTHSELLALNGRFAEMWKVQSERYTSI